MDFKKTKQLIFQAAIGSDAEPQATIANGLEVTTDSTIDWSAGSENSLSDIATATFSPRGTINGTNAGNGQINGYVKSTPDGVLAPSIGTLLRLADMTEMEGQIVTLDDASTLSVRDSIAVTSSGYVGVVYAIDGNEAMVYGTGTLATSDELDSGETVTDVATNKCFIYTPNTEGSEVGSLYVHRKTDVIGIQNVKGNMSISAESGAIPKFTFTAIGGADLVNRTMTEPSITYETSSNMVFKDSDMLMATDSISSVPVNASIEWNLGNDVQLVNDSVSETGIHSSQVVNRDEAGGTLTIYKDSNSVIDYKLLKTQDEVFDLSYRLGNGENFATIYVNQRNQLGQLTSGDTNGLVTETIPLSAKGSGDDETIIVFR